MNVDFKNKKVIFYDGDCGFCNSTVQFILKKRKTEFYFMALQHPEANEILKMHNIQINLDTFYYLNHDKVYERSSAALQVSKGLKGLYPALIIFYAVPKFIRDAFYNFIAKRRHKLRNGFCVLPKDEERKYFLQ